ncbi:type I polyketide synthase [Nocardioides bruguierae]|uniref:Acyltransferase domain-containing protein n=1 Tax=Nocardioides bruguierae TaxID=2945102 RepID=A0A9X2IHI2_9ACTN|nr:type I polyketide synthase [Nocardioides bruguierae]MCM0622629.1 acyltransferase domain-containing protein [Nocardioides bruguierae]
MRDDSHEPIAVIGMALRLPGALTPEQFWHNITEGVVSVGDRSRAELLRAGVSPDEADDPDYVPVHGVLDGADRFDAECFGFSPREAALIDPQQRKFLECASEALEDAGYLPRARRGRVGVIACTGNNAYLVRNLLPALAAEAEFESTAMLVAAEKDHVATRVAHRLGLTGPAFTVQTSCSSSLVAVHLAVQSLRAGDADMCIAGGASIQVPLGAGYLHAPGGIASPTGRCRPFDVGADGTVFGSGVGAVVLKPLSTAVADGDRIDAVILGTAINNDGARKVGYTAPSVQGQAEVIRAAQRAAGVRAHDIQYVETHGTGTGLGDAIEIAALQAVYQDAELDEAVVLGALKPNIGHTDSASGISALIKVVLALRSEMLPPTPSVTEVDPDLSIDPRRFRFCGRPERWEARGGRQRAGVSSFGLGGTNAHVIVERAPDDARKTPTRTGLSLPSLLPLSARDEDGLRTMRADLADRLITGGHPIGDVARTLQDAREPRRHRVFAVGHSSEELVASLARANPAQAARRPGLGFAFSGFGQSALAALADLSVSFPVFKATAEAAASAIRDAGGPGIDALMAGARPATGERADPRIAQPAMFVLQVGLARTYDDLGLAPEWVIGHSLGEYAAAYVAGALSLPAASALVVTRSRVMEALGPGAMTSVRAPERTVRDWIRDRLDVAAVNADDAVVVSGAKSDVEELEAFLEARGTRFRRLEIGFAAHSRYLDPFLAGFRRVEDEHRESGTLSRSFVSSVSGRTFAAGETLPGGYWTEHLRATVRFADAARSAMASADRVVAEIGTGHAMSYLMQQATDDQTALCIPGVQSDPDRAASDGVLRAVGTAWTGGVDVRWSRLRGPGAARLAPAPVHPFADTRHWIERRPAAPLARENPPEVPEPASGAGSGQADESARAETNDDGSRHESVTSESLREVWANVLGRPVPEDANFFALGGDSLALLGLAKKIQEAFQVRPTLRELSANADVASMVTLVRETQGPS